MNIQTISSKMLEWLQQMDYSEVTVRHYSFSVNRLLEFYNSINETEYEPAKTAEFIEMSRSLYEEGEIHLSTFASRRKVSSLMDGYFHSGEFTWKVLPVWKKPKFTLNPYFDEILKEFRMYCKNKKAWCKEMLDCYATS